MNRRYISKAQLACALGAVASQAAPDIEVILTDETPPRGEVGAFKDGVVILAEAPRPAPDVVRERPAPSGHIPHQNLREAARRAGGQVWLDYRNARRAARGLPPLTE